MDKFEETKEAPTTFGYICPHKFHHACVERHIPHGRTCPICRQPEREVWRNKRRQTDADAREQIRRLEQPVSYVRPLRERPFFYYDY